MTRQLIITRREVERADSHHRDCVWNGRAAYSSHKICPGPSGKRSGVNRFAIGGNHIPLASVFCLFHRSNASGEQCAHHGKPSKCHQSCDKAKRSSYRTLSTAPPRLSHKADCCQPVRRTQANGKKP